ncbi:MAG: SixA phosphatase family protein [Gemmatimonadota bacterium]
MRFSNMVGLAFAALGLIGLLVLYRAGTPPPPPPSTAEEAAAPATPTTVVLVRHAEKADDGTDDPPLTEAGRARAGELADALARAGVDAVLATPYRRTRATAAPAAERFDAPITVVEVDDGGVDAHADAVARRIVEAHAGGTVLVVGHSNTIPAIVGALGGEVPPIDEEEYDRLIVAILLPDGSMRVVESRYGAPSAAPTVASRGQRTGLGRTARSPVAR